MLTDVHTHLLPPFLVDALEAAGRKPSLQNFPKWTPEAQLRLMDQIGVERALLSVSTPGVHFGDDRAAAALARQSNEYCAELIAGEPRFGAFAALPLPFVDGAIEELRYALGALRLDGIGLFASYGETFLGDPTLEPVMAELQRWKAAVFVHPMGHPSSRALRTQAPLWMAEYPIDTTRAAVNLIVSGALDRAPDVKLILAHSGGALPFLQPRLSAMSLIDGRYAHLSPERVDRAIASLFYETAQAAGAASFAALSVVTTPDHILFGSDFPYCGEAAIKAMRQGYGAFAAADPGAASRLFANR